MRVIHIFSINSGGAAIAAKRIAESVELSSNNEVKNEYLALYSVEKSKDVKAFYSSDVEMFVVKLSRKMSDILFEPSSRNYPGPFTTGKFGVANSRKLKRFLEEVDIVHIHWINRGFFSVRQLKKLADFGIPIIWTMHDMWAFTGGCHYDGECGNYKEKCKNCICVKSGRSDFSKEQDKKREVFERSNFYFIGCSKWITECARKSYVLKEQKNIECIPNPMDESFIEEIDPGRIYDLRTKYNIPKNKKIVLFGAMSLNDERKGGKLIHELISKIPDREYHVVVFGSSSREIERMANNVTALGAIFDKKTMHEIYSICDVFIALSLQENLANTVMESLASGTPVVAFNIGGMPDMIVDGVNGKLVKPFDLHDFIRSIEYVTNSPWMRQNAVEFVKVNFSNKKVGVQYYNLYRKSVKSKLLRKI